MKKFNIFIALTICILCGSVLSSNAEVPCDLNHDGKLGLEDAIIILRLLTGIPVDLNNLTGTVFNANGTSALGATVFVFSTNSYTATTVDDSGKFSLNVSQEKHTIMVSKEGLIDSYQIVDLSGGKSANLSFLLSNSLVSSGLLRHSDISHTITSNTINIGGTDYNATLNIPAQTSFKFAVGDTDFFSTQISLEYFNISNPLSVPLPSFITRSTVLNAALIIDKQAPSPYFAL